MAKELNWSQKRQDDEFTNAKTFLTSMGLHPSLEKVTFEDVKNGNIAARRSLGNSAPRTKDLTAPEAGSKEERRTIPVERSGGGT